MIKLAFEKAKTADFETLNRVLGTVFPQVSTSLWVDDLYVSLKNINKYHLGETMGFPEARGDANMGKKGACVIPQTLETNVVKLHQFLFGTEEYTPSETVKNISKKIAADSGMYKEGNYVKSVNTDGGVIQQPKTTAAETTKAAAEEDDDRYEYISVLNANGKKVKKRIPKETDADGDYIEQETDENGIATGWMLDENGQLVRRRSTGNNNAPTESSVSDRPGSHPTEAETDVYGNPVETESRRPNPGETTTEESMRPGLRPTESTNAQQPNTRPTTGADRPGGFDEGPGGPGNTDPTRSTDTASPSPQPIPSPGGDSTNPTSPSTSGNGGGPGGAPGVSEQPLPGMSTSGGNGNSPMDIGNQGPGSQTSDSQGTGGSVGPVAGPGQ